MTAVYRSAELGAVLVERRGVFEVVAALEGRYMRFTLPGDAVKLLDPDVGAAAVLDELA